MSDVALVLGPVAFAGFEIPERIGFGGTQRLAVHDLPGGSRIIDVMGRSPAEISWSGIFSGEDATLRARTLDALRKAGDVLTLGWDVFLFSVLLHNFTADYRSTGWIEYSIGCTVVQDPTDAFITAGDDLLSDVTSDIASAAGYLLNSSLSGLASLFSDAGAGDPGTGAYLDAGNGLGTQLSSVLLARNTAGTALTGYAGSLSAGGVAPMIAQAGIAATSSAAACFLGRAAGNLFDTGF